MRKKPRIISEQNKRDNDRKHKHKKHGDAPYIWCVAAFLYDIASCIYEKSYASVVASDSTLHASGVMRSVPLKYLPTPQPNRR